MTSSFAALFIRTALYAVGLTMVGGCGPGQTDGPSSAEERLYTCGMHPQVVEDEAGTCPICGMDLTPMRDGSDNDADAAVISSGVIQQMGVRTAPVKRSTVFKHIRTLGEVEVGEDEVSVVNLRFSGWVEKIHVDRTGDQVERGQALFDIYSPELVSSAEEYLLAIRTHGADSPLAASSRRRLERWDVASWDIDRIAKQGSVPRTITIRAPAGGYVLHKSVVEGARVQAGHDLYRIGNLQRIWVTAEVYENDAPWVVEGQAAQMELSNSPGDTVDGHVSYVYPTMNQVSRTLPVRLEFDNPGVRLKPGMFATVYIQYRRKDDTIAVPTEAILHSGRRQIVFIAEGQGRFSAREVTTGLVGDHRLTEVLTGLDEGDVVVVSGQFLIDSESNLHEAIRKIVSTSPASAMTDHDHDHGMPTADAEPGQYTCPMHPEVIQDEAGRCPECGMFLEQVPGVVEQ